MSLKITSFGESAKGIQLSGNRKSCEPDHVRIAFPGGDVEVVRATDGDCPNYWVHVRVNHPKDGMNTPGETLNAHVIDGRLDIHEKNTSENDMGDFNSPDLYHVAIKIQPSWEGTPH